jgi:hypothetical protein
MLAIWAVMLVDLHVDTNFLEKNTVSIFRAED